LEFLTGDYNSAKDSAATEQLSLEKIQENLTRLMKENTSFDEICSWITVSVAQLIHTFFIVIYIDSFLTISLLFQVNVGNREKDPQFIRHLMTAILETTLGMYRSTLSFKIFLNYDFSWWYKISMMIHFV